MDVTHRWVSEAVRHPDAQGCWIVHHVSRASARMYTCSVDGTGNLEGGREPRTGS